MKRALFMTVGTGVGLDREKKVRNLAHGLLTSIEHYNPDIVVFFGSKDSIETVESLKEQYYEKKGEELGNYEFVELKSIDDFYECYTKIEEEIKKKEDYEIIIDYTSGTKTMTTSAAICAMLYQKRLSLVAGKRGENGVVIPGTEAAREQNLFAAYDKYLFDKVKEAFNSYRFGEAMGYLDQIVALDEKEEYKKLVKAYDLWDKFEHERAYKFLEEIRREMRKKCGANKDFLANLLKADRKEPYLIVDLLNNAKRRMEEGKYDDAVARLYRIIELIAQSILKTKYEINSSDVDVWHLKTLIENKTIEKYEMLRDEKGKIKLPLKKDFELLHDLGDKIGKKFLKDNSMKDLLTKRNNSILAHGLVPVKKEDAERMFGKVKEYVEEAVEDSASLMEKSAFPKL